MRSLKKAIAARIVLVLAYVATVAAPVITHARSALPTGSPQLPWIKHQLARCFPALLIVIIAIAIGPLPAGARGVNDGPGIVRPVVSSLNSRHTFGFHRDYFLSHRRVGHLRDFQRFHRRDRAESADWYYPYGYDDWYYWYYLHGYYEYAPPNAAPNDGDR